jgi:hypothetical protein
MSEKNVKTAPERGEEIAKRLRSLSSLAWSNEYEGLAAACRDAAKAIEAALEKEAQAD